MLNWGMISSGGVIADISYITLAQISASATITIPASSQVGDLAVLFDCNYGAGNSGTPSGWTNIIQGGGPVFRQNISYKKLVGGDPGSSVTGVTDTRMVKVMLIFRAGTITTIAHQDTDIASGTGDLAAQTVLSGSSSNRLIVFGCKSTNTGTSTLTGSTAFDAELGPYSDGTNLNALVGYKIMNSGQSNHTVDAPDNGSYNVLSSFYVEVS